MYTFALSCHVLSYLLNNIGSKVFTFEKNQMPCESLLYFSAIQQSLYITLNVAEEIDSSFCEVYYKIYPFSHPVRLLFPHIFHSSTLSFRAYMENEYQRTVSQSSRLTQTDYENMSDDCIDSKYIPACCVLV